MNAKQSKEIEFLYLQMYSMLFEYARSSLTSDNLAEEAIQEVFRIACQKPEAVCASPNPQGWTVVTLKYVVANMMRNKVAAERVMAKYAAVNPDLPDMHRNQIEVELLYNDIANTDEFQLLKEITFEGMSYEEMAKKRGITVQACRKRMQRAKEFLRKKIQV